MEEKKTIKIGVGGLLLIILIVVAITAACTYMVIQFTTNNVGTPATPLDAQGINANNQEENTVSNIANTDMSNNVGTLTATTETSKKVDANKEWVYDATYNNDNTLDLLSYSIQYKDTTVGPYTFDVKVPYININSNRAKYANMEIEKLYYNYAVEFSNGKKMAQEGEKIGEAPANAVEAEISYETYINDNVLSVVIKYATSSTDVPYYEYMTYNFDLNTLDELDYSDVYEKAGFTDDSIDTSINKAIENYKFYTDKEYTANSTKDNIKEYIKESKEAYRKAAEEDLNVKSFLDESGKLNIVTLMFCQGGRQQQIEILQIK